MWIPSIALASWVDTGKNYVINAAWHQLGFDETLILAHNCYLLALIQYNIMLFIDSAVERVCGTLPGSCIAAGYTGCCTSSESNDQCSGVPSGQCFCDSTCMNSGDCCEDLHEICNGPEVG